MASNPPFQVMEDQTDEDFFDKLVDDDFGPTSSDAAQVSKFSEGSDSDEAKAFANMSIEDVNGGGEDGGVVEEEVRDDGNSGDVPAGISGSPTEESDALNSSGSGNAVDSSNDGLKSKVAPDLDPMTDVGSTKSGAKEVGWGSLYAGSAPNGNNEFGSCSDFFSELEGHSDDSIAKVGGSTNIETNAVGEIGNFVSYLQENVNGQDVNSTQYWESMYPGWKYDMNTGKWYQVDSCGATVGLQESYNANSGSEWPGAADGKGEVNFLQQSSHSVAATVADTKVSHW
ncbi:unnamed protein product [Linum trigynum]|uniref:Uncharacterized protein n=1 Tax=Linum trigynum TaxID=586398 RepID=A0AAV2FCT6_9ROSI